MAGKKILLSLCSKTNKVKNLHLIPTDKPSRFYKNDNQVLILNTHPVLKGIFTNGIGSNQHIYITSDEEIKAGDYIFETDINIINIADKDYYRNEFDFKIILTTDQSLDGVQAIPDEFLEWFVKNPSCEQVEIDKGYRGVDLFNYKIIIPKQETTLEEAEKEFEKLLNGKALPTKQLTEVAEHYFIIGYEIGQERMYSEEEVLKILLAKNADLGIIGKTSEVIEWFEQFKK